MTSSIKFAGLPNTRLATYLENRVNTFLRKKDAGAGEVIIRVLSSADKATEVKTGMRARLVGSNDVFRLSVGAY